MKISREINTKWLWLSGYALLLIFIGYFMDRVAMKYFHPYSFSHYFLASTVLFFIGYYLYAQKKFKWNRGEIIYLGIFMRSLLFFMHPNLSDDFHRFLWDGRLVLGGINPFMHLPSDLYQSPLAQDLNLSQDLYDGFNSHHYYSVYPPVNQIIYTISAWFSHGNLFHGVLSLRLFILMAEIGSMLFLSKLMQRFNVPIRNLLLYALNPLILLELTGNLHFEGIMIFFLLGAIHFLYQSKHVITGILWGLAIATKLLPLLFLAFLWRRINLKQQIIITASACLTFGILFIPFWEPEVPYNIKDSLDRYFGYFQFNAGIPYLLSYIGSHFTQQNALEIVLSHTSKVILAFVAIYTLYSGRKKSTIVEPILWTGLVYFLLAGILHPWYITFLIPLCLLSKYRFPLVWSVLIQLSYSAYNSADYLENNSLIAIEFILLILYLIFEIRATKKHSQPVSG